MANNALKYEEMTDAELDALVVERQKSGQNQSVNYESMSDAEIDNLVAQKMGSQPQQSAGPQIQPSETEAELGLMGRAQYAIEPLQSNRLALLQQQFGAGNVVQDRSGTLYVRQNGELRPVNAPGFSTGDIAEIGGVLPEMVGGAVGGLIGLPAGPAGAIGGAMVGGASGSVARQAFSAFLGTPQVAELSERAEDAAISSVLSVVGLGFGKLLKVGGQQALRGVTKLGKRKILESTAKSIKSADDLSKLFNDFNIPGATTGQRLGAQSVKDAEKDLSKNLFFGKALRKRFNEQSEAIVDRLKGIFGDFTDETIDIGAAGQSVKRIALTATKAIKESSQQSFQAVDDVMKGTGVNGLDFTRKMMKHTKGMRLFTPDGRPLKYSARSGMAQEEFEIVQKALKNASDAVFETSNKNGVISVGELNSIRQSVQQAAFANVDTPAGRVLSQMHDRFIDTIDDSLKKTGNKQASTLFKEARAQWYKYRQMNDAVERLGLKAKPGQPLTELADAKVMDRVFSNTTNSELFRELVGEKHTKEALTAHIRQEFTKRLSAEKSLTSGSLARWMNNPAKKDVLQRIYGKEQVNKVIKLLQADASIKVMPNPSGTAYAVMRMDPTDMIVQGVTLRGVLAVLSGAASVPKLAVKAATKGPRFAKPSVKSGLEGIRANERFKEIQQEKGKRK